MPNVIHEIGSSFEQKHNFIRLTGYFVTLKGIHYQFMDRCYDTRQQIKKLDQQLTITLKIVDQGRSDICVVLP